jgi:hypothetical protein
MMARNVEEAATFVFVQLIEEEPYIYDKRHPNYARRDKIDWLEKEILMKRRSLDPG